MLVSAELGIGFCNVKVPENVSVSKTSAALPIPIAPNVKAVNVIAIHTNRAFMIPHLSAKSLADNESSVTNPSHD